MESLSELEERKSIEEWLALPECPPTIRVAITALLPRFTQEDRDFVESNIARVVERVKQGDYDGVLEIVDAIAPSYRPMAEGMLAMVGAKYTPTLVEEAGEVAPNDSLAIAMAQLSMLY